MSLIEPGREAPNFDLSSTEDVLLMLRDEVVRTAVVLYFFAADDDRSRRDLSALAASRDALAEDGARILGVSPLKLPVLKELQKELGLPFPLLQDDRGFAARYGALVSAEGEGEAEESAAPALVAVDRYQKVLWAGTPASVETEIAAVRSALSSLPRASDSLPSSVVNRWIDRLVH